MRTNSCTWTEKSGQVRLECHIGVRPEWHVLKVEPIGAPGIGAPPPSERHGGRSLQTLNPKGSVGNALRGVPSVARGPSQHRVPTLPPDPIEFQAFSYRA